MRRSVFLIFLALISGCDTPHHSMVPTAPTELAVEAEASEYELTPAERAAAVKAVDTVLPYFRGLDEITEPPRNRDYLALYELATTRAFRDLVREAKAIRELEKLEKMTAQEPIPEGLEEKATAFVQKLSLYVGSDACDQETILRSQAIDTWATKFKNQVLSDEDAATLYFWNRYLHTRASNTAMLFVKMAIAGEGLQALVENLPPEFRQVDGVMISLETDFQISGLGVPVLWDGSEERKQLSDAAEEADRVLGKLSALLGIPNDLGLDRIEAAVQEREQLRELENEILEEDGPEEGRIIYLE
jgi:hypothetical protein